MALKGLTKSAQEPKSTDQKIEDFISGSTKRVKSLETSQQIYRRFTFSLTEEVSQEILNTTQTICDLLSAMGTVTDAQRQSILRSLKRITVRIFVSAHSLE